MNGDGSSDIIYGFLSIVDQFGSVLRQRGQEYRKSSRGRQFTRNLDGLLARLSETQREALRLTVASLDGLIKIVEEVDSNLARQAQAVNGKRGKARPARSAAGRNGKGAM